MSVRQFTLERNFQAFQALLHVCTIRFNDCADNEERMLNYPGGHELNYLAQAHWHHFRYRFGEMVGLDRTKKEVWIAATHDEEGRQITPPLHCSLPRAPRHLIPFS